MTSTATLHPTDGPADPEATPERARRHRARLLMNLFLVLLLAGAGAVMVLRPSHATPTAAKVPHSAAMEKLTGVRFTRVTEVGDGGLLTVYYVVLDPEKATKFQADREHPPRLRAEKRTGGTQRASIMRAGHLMRPGQTYYLVYENTRGAIRSGETTSISYGGVTLAHVPVL